MSVNVHAAPLQYQAGQGENEAVGLVHPISTGMSLLPPSRHLPRHSLAANAYGRRHISHIYNISCVPYARRISGIQVVGDAWQWWHRAAGHYARGDAPEVGSVLNFRSNRRMPLGHVAVVDKIVNSREIIVEHANWPSGGLPAQIMHGVIVVDVSEANNWSAVRVELGRAKTFGAVYPAYGFIYNRPDTGVIASNVLRPAPQPDINPISSDLRPQAERPWRTTVVEVAELPAKLEHPTGAAIIPVSTRR